MKTKKKNKTTKCKLCDYAIPVNATECPNCGTIIELDRSEEIISQTVPGPEPSATISVIGQPEEFKTDELHQDEPSIEISPELAEASVPWPSLEPDQGGIRQSQTGDSYVQKVQEGVAAPLAIEQDTASSQDNAASLLATPQDNSPQPSRSRRFSKAWISSAFLLAGLIFIFSKYLESNDQMQVMSNDYRNTVLAQNQSLGQAESTLSAQQNMLLALENTLSAQQTHIADQIDLDMTLFFGPEDGRLIHKNDGLIKTYWAGQNVKNFIISVELVNPYPSTFHSWDTCIRFRRNYTDEYRLTIFSTQQWEMTFGLSTEPIASGALTNLRMEDGESNTVLLVVRDDLASLKINNVLVSYLDVSAYLESGDIGIAIGTRQGDEVIGKSTIFQKLTLWKIP